MAVLDKSQRLSKELKLFDVFALSTGATLSSGFFLLPGLAAAVAGPAVVLAYGLAVIPLLPGIISKIELATAMPRAGGVYYFLDRSLGPLFGTISGLGTWLSIVLKVSFALVGMGAYLHLFWEPDVKTLAIGLAVAFGVLNFFGARRTGILQVLFVLAVLLILIIFIGTGAPKVQRSHFEGFFDEGAGAIAATVGMVCISYIGLTKVASVAEEVREPERNLPRGMFLSLAVTSVIYVTGTVVMIGVLEPDAFYRGETPDLTPVSSTASAVVGPWGGKVLAVAAILAFFSVANAGILSASRYPLAMSRDRLMPVWMQRLSSFKTPTWGIVITVALIVVTVLSLPLLEIAKLAGAFQLLLFALNCVAVIVMRESRIQSYDPGYRAPFYPWMQLVGIVAPLGIIAVMGWLPIAFSSGLVVIGVAWFWWYGRRRVHRVGAIYHVFERLGRRRFEELDTELRSILKEKGLREQDPFEEIIAGGAVLDVPTNVEFETVVDRVSQRLAERLPATSGQLAETFLQGTRMGATPVTGGVALPHLRLPDVDRPVVALVRCVQGVDIPLPGKNDDERELIYAVFFLVSPEDDPAQHLRLLAQLASRVDEDGFIDDWLGAPDAESLREILLRHERHLGIDLDPKTPAGELIGSVIRDVELVDGTLIAIILRGRESIVPRGSTVLQDGDRLTIIGDAPAIRELRQRFGR